ncbi:DUF1854 domain-containing protein [bacterium]|nr:MAG: DUF1854 domain-containing protein [bacterium]
MAKSTEKGPQTIDAGTIELRAVEGSSEIDVRLDGEWIEGIKLHRCFPLSEPSRFISILGKDGKERAILDDLDRLDVASRSLANAELDRRYFTPEIERIESLKSEAGMWRFAVVTGRGESDFWVRNWRESAFELSPNRWVIHSVDGGRYEIPNLEGLDAGSRRLLDQLL